LRRLFRERLFELDHLTERRRGGVPDGANALERPMLVEQRMPQSRLPRDAASRRLHRAREDAEERGLARAIATDDAPTVAFTDGEGDALQEGGGAVGDTDVGAGDQGHSAIKLTDRDTGNGYGGPWFGERWRMTSTEVMRTK